MFGIKKRKEKKELEERRAARKIALCLGGGGARGFAHIGAVRAFEEANISFDLIVGCSVGALVGALYAFGTSSEAMIRYASSLRLRDVYNGVIIKPDDPMKIGKIATDILGGAEISLAPTRFAAVATDISAARLAVLDSGNVGAAVAASCAVPVLYKPLVYGGKHLCDGGLLNNIPADVCRMLGAQAVVTVDVNPSRGGGTDGLGMLDVLRATFHIMAANSSVEGLRQSDVIIAPDTGNFSSTSKNGWEEMIDTGYRAAKEKISEIRALKEA